jgi:hypothetical protein
VVHFKKPSVSHHMCISGRMRLVQHDWGDRRRQERPSHS